ncbi:MAG: ribosomal subunit interface protein [Deltaproteobacteria bacterium CG11_big_fil_rev_8_21_14_0_20_45_16]|nr:MAG: ribosomal subunit interface protein [Deltaproteobacteria bacterium CG11_big_fil_rev_8_21_14_0_20_45_16]
MKLDVVFKEMESTPSIQSRVEEKAKKLECWVAADEYIRVVVEAKFKGQQHAAEIAWHDNKLGKDFFAKAEGHDLYAQIDEVFDKIVKQVSHAHEKQVDKKRHFESAKKMQN